MNIKRIFLTLSLVLFCLPAYGMVEFLKKSAAAHNAPCVPQEAKGKIVTHDFDAPIPEDIKKVLDEHSEELNEENWVFSKAPTFPWLKGWCIKESDEKYERIEGSKKFAEAINSNGYDKLTVLPVYPYKSPHGKHFTIEPFVKRYNEKINRDEAQQIYRVAKKVRWCDSHTGNLIKIAKNIVAIIDTELIDKAADLVGKYNDFQLRDVIIRIMLFNSRPFYDQQACDYLKRKRMKNLSQCYLNWYLTILALHPDESTKKCLLNKLRSLSHQRA